MKSSVANGVKRVLSEVGRSSRYAPTERKKIEKEETDVVGSETTSRCHCMALL